MKALILAAGYATRLYPITKEYPKPLLKVGERPIIDYIIDKLDAIAWIDEIFVVTNSKFYLEFRKWKEHLNPGKRVVVVDDLTKSHADRRGAIGDIDFVIKKKNIREDLLVIGGDNLFEGGLADFLACARSHKTHPVIGVYDIKDKALSNKYGVIKMNGRNRIIDFQEKPGIPKSTLVAMCLYYFPRNCLTLIKEYLNTKDKHDATGFYIDWLRKAIPVYGFVFDGCWYDIGDHKFYQEAKESFKS